MRQVISSLFWYCSNIIINQQHDFSENMQVGKIYSNPINHNVFLFKLKKYYLPDAFLTWLGSYLKNRVQIMKRVVCQSNINPQGFYNVPILDHIVFTIILIIIIIIIFSNIIFNFFGDVLKIYYMPINIILNSHCWLAPFYLCSERDALFYHPVAFIFWFRFWGFVVDPVIIKTERYG